MAALPVPLHAVGVPVTPEEHPVRRLLVRRRLRAAEHGADLALRPGLGLRGSPTQAEAPLTNHRGEAPQLVCSLDSPQGLRERHAVPRVAEAVVVVEVEAYVCMTPPGHRRPGVRDVSKRTLKDGQNYCDVARVHSCAAYCVDRPVIETQELVEGYAVGRLVAYLDAGDGLAHAVAPRHDLERPQRVIEAPLRPMPAAVSPPARRIPTLPTRSPMQIQYHLQA
mmetsp:Transcript_87881/g.246821  ORF Transcript_87881/g.246821 Transcript_87881/m.246821 type:complete len:223 (+) Transcript_87881:901-1569(+)